MSYRVFVSHIANDKLIAEEVTRVINNAFEGDIELYLAFQEIGGGDEWKKSIKDNLNICDALVCLITSEYVHKPWLFIEWSAFWLADKKYYILLTDDIKLSDLVHPMQDRQVTYMLDESSVRMFFRSLSTDSKHSTIPYEHVIPFIDAVRGAIFIRDNEKMKKSFDKYKDNLDKLPVSDLEKKTIAEYYYKNADFGLYSQIASKIRDDAIKSSMAIYLVNQGDLTSASQLVEKILSADKLAEIALILIDLQHHDSIQVRELIENIASKNQAELRKVAIYLLNRGEGDSGLFEFIIENMTNMAEMRKIAIHLIENGHHKTTIFITLFEKLQLNNQREMEKVMIELFARDKNLFFELLEKYPPTNNEVLIRLNELAKG